MQKPGLIFFFSIDYSPQEYSLFTSQPQLGTQLTPGPTGPNLLAFLYKHLENINDSIRFHAGAGEKSLRLYVCLI